tara:strand:- start:2213 stop:3484 length:1272 start_codon:yes stop_codon:yes gene_type:complete
MLKDKIYNSDFLKHILVLVSGTILAQIIPVLLQPFLRRIYSPEQFGLFAVYSSIFSMLAVVAAGKYDTTIVVPKEDSKASYLVLGSIIISLFFSLVCLFFFILFNEQIILFFDFPQTISSWLYFIPLSILFIAIFRSLNNWLIRKKQFKESSYNKIIRRTAEGTAQLTLSLFNGGSGLIIGNIVGDFFNLIFTFFQAKKSKLQLKFTPHLLKEVLYKYKDYPIYSAIPSLLNAVSLFLPVLIINKFYSQESTGYFDLSRQMLALPLALISTTVSQVLLQKVAEQKNNATKISSFILKLSSILLILSVVGGSIIYLFGPQLFSFIFGSDWLISGEIAQILVFGYCIKFIVSPLSTVFISLEKIRISSIWQVFYFSLICLLLLMENIDLEHFLMYYVIIDIVAYSIYFVLILIITKNYDNQLSNE